MTSFVSKDFFRFCSVHHGSSKSSVGTLLESTLGSSIVVEIEVKELWEAPNAYKSSHSDGLMSAATGQIIIAKESERPHPRMTFKTSLVKRWGGDLAIVGSKKHKSTESININGNLFMIGNDLKLQVQAVSNYLQIELNFEFNTF